jgi:hypothetical protein
MVAKLSVPLINNPSPSRYVTRESSRRNIALRIRKTAEFHSLPFNEFIA